MSMTDMEVAAVPYSTMRSLETAGVAIAPNSDPIDRWPADGLLGYAIANADRLSHPRRNATAEAASTDDVLASVEKMWSTRNGGRQDLLSDYGKLACEVFVSDRGMPRIRSGASSGANYSLLNQRMDRSVLVCAWAAWQDPPVRSASLQRKHFWVNTHEPDFVGLVKDAGGLAETHAHAHACLTTEIAWLLAVALSEKTAKKPGKKVRADDSIFLPNGAEEGGPIGPGSGEAPEAWLSWSKATRTLLEVWLSLPSATGAEFAQWAGELIDRVCRGDAMLSSQRRPNWMSRAWVSALQGKLDAWSKLKLEQIHALCRGIAPTSPLDRPQNAVSLAAQVEQERLFLVAAFSRARADRQTAGSGYAPGEFDRALLQYVRIRNVFHRWLVFSGRFRGFRLFSGVFRRGSTYSKAMTAIQGGMSYRLAELDPGALVRSMELRYASGRDGGNGSHQHHGPHSLLSLAQPLREDAGISGRRFGLVFHFVKWPASRRIDESFDLYRQRQRSEIPLTGIVDVDAVDQWRLGRAFTLMLGDGRALNALLGLEHQCHLIRGYDVAGVEDAMPNWPFLAVMGKIHDVGEATGRGRPGSPVPRFTFHAGEFYSHVVVGLARVAQVLRRLGNWPESRIGHGVVLSPKETRRGWAGVNNEEWAMAVAWAHEAYAAAGRSESALTRTAEALMGELSEHAGITTSVRKLAQTYADMEDWRKLEAIGYAFRNPAITSESLLAKLLREDSAYAQWASGRCDREDLPEEVLQQLREDLIGDIHKTGTTIEACPSSNVAIAAQPSRSEDWFADHPAFHLKLQRVSVNSDDPVTFATDLATEHWHMYRAARSNGMDADAWSKERIRQGHRSSFVVDAPWTEIISTLNAACTNVDARAAEGQSGIVEWYRRGV